MAKTWVQKTDKELPTIAEIKKAIRSENFPHSQLAMTTSRNAHDWRVSDAEKMLLATKVLEKVYNTDPKNVRPFVEAAIVQLRSAISSKLASEGETVLETRYAVGTVEMERKYSKAIDRCDKLIPREPVRS